MKELVLGSLACAVIALAALWPGHIAEGSYSIPNASCKTTGVACSDCFVASFPTGNCFVVICNGTTPPNRACIFGVGNCATGGLERLACNICQKALGNCDDDLCSAVSGVATENNYAPC